MHLVKEVFSEGGLFAIMVVAAGVIGLAVDFLQLVLIRRLDLTALIAGTIAGTLLLGLLGTALGSIHAYSAMAYAAPDERSMLLARGLSMSLLTTWLAAFVAGAQCFFGALAATIRVNVQERAAGGKEAGS